MGFSVTGRIWPGFSVTVQQVLVKLPGVGGASADRERGSTMVRHGALVGNEACDSAIWDAGFGVSDCKCGAICRCDSRVCATDPAGGGLQPALTMSAGGLRRISP